MKRESLLLLLLLLLLCRKDEQCFSFAISIDIFHFSLLTCFCHWLRMTTSNKRIWWWWWCCVTVCDRCDAPMHSRGQFCQSHVKLFRLNRAFTARVMRLGCEDVVVLIDWLIDWRWWYFPRRSCLTAHINNCRATDLFECHLRSQSRIRAGWAQTGNMRDLAVSCYIRFNE